MMGQKVSAGLSGSNGYRRNAAGISRSDGDRRGAAGIIGSDGDRRGAAGISRSDGDRRGAAGIRRSDGVKGMVREISLIFLCIFILFYNLLVFIYIKYLASSLYM